MIRFPSKLRLLVVPLLLASCQLSSARAQTRRDGSPLDHLPAHVKQLTSWGERPDFRQDGQRILFLSKVFGDVYEYEISTGRITPCTDHFKHHGFTRALYLSNGDVLLSGPVATFDRTDKEARQKARSSSYLSVLDKSFTQPPVPLNEHCDEGPAVSRQRLRIAWTHGLQDRISTADLEYENGVPKLVNKRQVVQASDFPEGSRPQRWIEAQNFVPPHDKQLTVTAYELNGTANSEAFLLDLDSGTLTNLSRSPDHYEEIEGMFPDGKSTLVESAEITHRWPLVDLYRLSLDGSGKKERLTHFTDFKGWKAAEATISDDGRFMLFQDGRGGMEAGQGFSIYLYDFEKAAKP